MFGRFGNASLMGAAVGGQNTGENTYQLVRSDLCLSTESGFAACKGRSCFHHCTYFWVCVFWGALVDII